MLLYLFPIIAFLFIFLHPTKLLLILADGMPNLSLKLNAGPLVIYFYHQNLKIIFLTPRFIFAT